MTQTGYGLDDDMGAGTYMEDISTYVKAMLDDWNIKLVLSGVATFFSEWFGADWWLIQCLFILLLTDCFLGITNALYFDKQLSGRRLHDGMVKFMAYAISIILVYLVQEICRRTIPFNLPVMGVYAGYQSLTEIKSISRHLERLGFKMPRLFHRVTHGVENKINQKLEEEFSEKKDDA